MMAEIESLTVRHLQEFRAELKERDERVRADIARVHADVARAHSDVIGRLTALERSVAQVQADVLETKSLVLDVVVKLTNIEKRVAALEPAEHAQ